MPKYILFVLIFIIIIWSFVGSGFNLQNLIQGIPYGLEYIRSTWPPNLKYLPNLTMPLIETFQIAIAAITVSSIIAFPIGFLSARNITKSSRTVSLARFILNTLRGLPPLLYALLFVAMVGLGPFPGTLGLIFHDIGALGKYFSETIENINPELLLSGKATGAKKINIIRFVIFPELKPLFSNYILYYFEYNIRSASILGLVGAGGIGYELTKAIKLFQYHEVSLIIIILILIITIVDMTSAIIRKKIIDLKQ